MKWFIGFILIVAMDANADNVVIQSFDSAGKVTFNRVTNSAGYRVEWASEVGGTWTSFTAASIQELNNISPAGSGIVTAYVPMLYRVVTLALASNATPVGMVLIPGGTFAMGHNPSISGTGATTDESPMHTVDVSDVYMDLREVTKSFWDDVKAYNSGNGYSDMSAGNGKATNHPVQTINWYDAVKWCNARSEKDGRTPVYYTDTNLTVVYRTGEIAPNVKWSANGYRLPTEAEWEKASRGGIVNGLFPNATAYRYLDHSYANYNSILGYEYDLASGGYHPAYSTNGFPYTSPVGSFAPNAYGLYDMAGNVEEWCWDWYSNTYYSISAPSNPTGPTSGLYRVVRGGDWYVLAKNARCSNREWIYSPTAKNYELGFRCACRP